MNIAFVLAKFLCNNVRESFIEDVGSLVEKGKRGSRTPSSGGLRVRRGHHVSPRLRGSLHLFVPLTRVHSLHLLLGPGV